MEETGRAAVMSAVRSVLGVIGGYIVGKGLASEEMVTQIIGAIMAVTPLLWGVWDKFKTEEKTQERETLAVNAGIVVADNTVGKTPVVTADQAQAVIKENAPAEVPK